ncbi:putative rSAM-modified RiPP, XyeA family [Kosakonia cowanii]|nr:putative rSAM-modified RiPP, XyeA family [Kosakonia cowanii]
MSKLAKEIASNKATVTTPTAKAAHVANLLDNVQGGRGEGWVRAYWAKRF